jgi:hypothetical protein
VAAIHQQRRARLSDFRRAPEKFRIKLPRVFADLVGAAGTVALEHAALNARAFEALLGLALCRKGRAAFVTVDVPRALILIQEWCDAQRKNRNLHTARVDLPGLALWLSDEPGRIQGQEFSLVAVADAHLFDEDPLTRFGPRLAGADVLVSGQIAPRGHWFYKLARAEGTRRIRLDARTVAAAFPDQEPHVLKAGDPRYRRLMDLEDVKVRELPFVGFARSRLRIRTDRPLETLTPLQREGAVEGPADTDSGGSVSRIVPFDLTQVQKRYLALKRFARRKGFRKFLLLKYRKGGFSTLEQALSYRLCVSRPRTYAVTLAQTAKDTEQIFRIAKTFQETDAEPVNLLSESRGALQFENKSLFFIGTARAEGFSRGDTLQRFHGSEAAWFCPGPHQQDDVDQLMAGVLGAAARGEVVLETTPNGREWFYNKWTEAKKNPALSGWYPIFLPWFEDPTNILPSGTFSEEEIRDTLDDEERALVQKHQLSLPQIAFRRKIRKDFGRLAGQEHPEDPELCFLTSGRCFFDVEVVSRLLRVLPEYAVRHLAGGYEVEWAPPEIGVEYVAGCDTSEGLLGGDPNGVGILRRDTGAQVAAIHGTFNITDLAEHAVRLCRRYNDALLGVERENHGHAVLLKIMQLGYGDPHFLGGPLFYFLPRAAETASWKRPDLDAMKLARPGWDTNSATRPTMLVEMAEAIRLGVFPVRDREFLGECLSFRLQSDGKYRGDGGAHDDAVVKWAIAWQMRKQVRLRPDVLMMDVPFFTGGARV